MFLQERYRNGAHASEQNCGGQVSKYVKSKCRLSKTYGKLYCGFEEADLSQILK